MDRLLSLEPSNVVAIRVESGQRWTGSITLRNVMYTMPVAFRLQPKDRIHYNVVPQSGIIPPLKTVTLEITYLLPPDSTLPPRFNLDNQFTLESVVAPGAAAALKDPSSTSVPGEWFTNRRKQVYFDSGIKVMFVGSLVLAWLMEKGRMEEIRDVLEKSDPAWKSADATDSQGRSLMHLAINQGRPDLVQLLLEFHADIEMQDVSGSSPLEAAVAAGESLIVELLLAHKACPERSPSAERGPLHLVAGNGDFEVLGLLLKKGAKVNSLTLDGYTALHLAVMERRRDCARMLLVNAARADVQNPNSGETPLHAAASLGDEAMVKLLLSKGSSAIKYVRNKAGKTAYDLAAENGHGKLFDALKLGDRLCTAARRGDVRAIERLIDGGAAVNTRDQNGWTALHRAAFKGRVEAARALIAKGADIDAKDGDGYTALHCAVEAGQAEVSELLVKKGADVEAATNKGATAKRIAEAMEYVGILRIIVGGGGVVGKESVGKPGGGDYRRQRLQRRSIGGSTPLEVV